MTRLVLASGSSARRTLLANAGLSFDVVPASIDEPLPSDAPPAEVAVALALAKAHDVASREQGVVLGCDQVLVMPDGTSAGKPWSRDEARAQLRALQGRTHHLVSAAALVGHGREEVVAQDVRIDMRALSSTELEAVLDWNEWEGNAGSYQFEHRGVHLLERVEGDFFTVLGLPLMALLPALRAFGVGLP